MTQHLSSLPPQLAPAPGHPLFARLNSEQRAAATHGSHTALCLAGPGAGKTHVLVVRQALLIEAGVDPAHLLAVTFTNKAAKELRQRLGAMVGEEPARKMTVGTFHSLCARWLRRDAPVIGRRRNFSIYDADDSDRIIAGLFKARQLETKGGKVDVVREMISRWKNDLLTPERAERKSNLDDPTVTLALQLYVEYENILRKNNALDFDDLLMKMVWVLRTDPEVLSRYQGTWLAVSCDEVQDNNKCQHELLLALTGRHENLFVIGDSQQSIYRFRGAMPESLRLLHNARPEAAIYRLGQNYRSTQIIVAAGQAIIDGSSARDREYTTNIWTSNPEGERIEIWLAYDQDEEATLIASTIAQHIRSGGKASDWGVLVRVNAQTRAIEAELIRRRIRHQIIGGQAFFERKEIKDVLAYLLLLRNKDDNNAVARAAGTPERGLGDTSLKCLLAASEEQGRSLIDLLYEQRDSTRLTVRLKPRPRAAVVAFVDIVDWLWQQARKVDVVSLLGELLNKIQFKAYLEKKYGPRDGDERWQNVRELVAAAQSFLDRPQAEQLGAFLDEIALLTSADLSEEDGDAVKLMTLHRAKGLEFPCVWLPGVEEDLLPYARAATPEDIAEERRLFFVGVTRPKLRLHLSYTQQRRLYQAIQLSEASRFLDAIPETLVVRR